MMFCKKNLKNDTLKNKFYSFISISINIIYFNKYKKFLKKCGFTILNKLIF